MTQTEAIKHHLLHVGPLTPIEALERYQCFRLAARIDELRRGGMEVETEIVRNKGKRWARYRVVGPVQTELFSAEAHTARSRPYLSRPFVEASK